MNGKRIAQPCGQPLSPLSPANKDYMANINEINEAINETIKKMIRNGEIGNEVINSREEAITHEHKR